ncbi:MAG TPA: choice-of-anchor J domain-containing protein [Bacteroidia bacterium]
MKKQLLSLLFAVCFVGSNAQVLLTESFEGATFPPPGWSELNNGTGNSWALNDFEPTFASDGVQSMFYEYSSTDPADAWAFTPALTLANGDSIVITFDYVVGGADYPESLKLTMGNGQTVVAQTTTIWDNASLIDETFVTVTAGVKITANGNYNFGFNCYSATDMYVLVIDNIKIRKVVSNDLEMHAYTGPTRACDFQPGFELSVDVSNIGAADLNGFPIGYRINGGPVVSETYTATLAAGTTVNYAYLTGADFSTPGTYFVELFTQLNSDGDQSNDTTSFTILSEASGLMLKSDMNAMDIPDNNPAGVVSAIPFCGIANNLGTNIQVKRLTIDGITHTWPDDIELTLFAPNGDSLLLAADIGADNVDYPTVTFTDTALTNIIVFDEDAIVSGYYHTQDSAGFAKFNGQDPNGVWRLRIVDDAGADVGTFNSWTLEFDNNVGIKEYKNTNNLIGLYPNPNNGLFTVQSLSSDAITVSIISINGQEIKNVEMSGSKDKQTIDLRGVAAGMYFVKAVSEKGIQTSKVIIE